MRIKERTIVVRLIEKMKKDPSYAAALGLVNKSIVKIEEEGGYENVDKKCNYIDCCNHLPRTPR